MADTVAIGDLYEKISDPDRIAADAFGILRRLCALVNAEDNKSGEVDSEVQELVLRALEQREAFGPASVVLAGLVRRLGLFPYLDADSLGVADSIAYEYHRPANMEGDKVIFHRAQAAVYRHLLAGQNVILSAPTSFGKSLVIDAMIAANKYRHIAIVVPTIALIDETRRRLARRFGRSYKIATHPSQARGDPELLIMTQERLLQVEGLAPIDFFVIDEFYKLQPRKEDTERSLVLNEAFYRLHKTGAQFYLLGPNIRGITNLPERVEYTFIKTDYRTVVSQLHRVDPGENDLEALVGLCRDLQDPTLVYCRSPKRVRDVAGALLEGGVGTPRDEVRAAVEWVGAEYHPDWSFGVALAHGIGMHHGQLPRTLSQYVVKAFNDGHLRFLVCTSTLIEGVNTKAKNVVVLDNTIALRRYDFFTYNNIAGRSGRMFQYFIGHVYMFHDLPAQQLPLIDIPVFTQPDDAPEALLIQIDEQDLAAQARRKISDLLTQDDVDVKVLRESRGIDPRRLVTLSRAIREHANEWAADLGWTGQPTHQQLRRVCELIWEYLVPDRRRRAGVVSGPQLAFKIERFRQSRGAANLIRTALREDQDAPGDIVEATIEFLRFWANFNFPRYLLAVNRVQRDVFARMRRPVGNYAMFAGQVENWFLDPAIMALDEYGIPVQVGEKLQELLHPEGDLDVALARLRELQLDDLPLTAFERSLVEDAVKHL